ncbi:MAG: HEAT repeat domain-containing protein, partial [Candidatus Brocadiae bacterium]|nr:HEAT repeat domain-containing protein [Candidatus Brocadiia bacterium]
YEEIENLKDPYAGIRLWYVRDNPGFVFLTYEEVIRVVKIGRLNDDARKIIEDRVRMKIAQAQIASEEERRRKDENLKKVGIGLTEQEEQTRLEEEMKDMDKKAYEQINKQDLLAKLPEESRKLLEDFPPEQGWSYELYERIKPRVNKAKVQKNFVGLPIAYRKFVDNFSLWQAAVDLLKAEEKNAFEKMKEKIRKDREEAKKRLEKEEEKKKMPVIKEEPTPQELAKEEAKKQAESATKAPENEPSRDIVQENITQLLYAKTTDKKLQAIRELGKLGAKASLAYQSLKMCLKDPDALVRRESIQALGRIREPKNLILDALADALELGDLLMRREAVAAFFLFGKDAASKFDLIASAATLDEDAKVRYRAIRSLEMIGDSRAVAQVQTRLWDLDPAVQVATASALLSLMENSQSLEEWIVEPLVKGLSHEEDQVRILASEVLKKFSNRVEDLKEMKKFKKTLNALLPRAKEEIKNNLQDALNTVEVKIKEAEEKEKQKEEQSENMEEIPREE